ncbi:MAG: peptidase dimerization domain-containing protein [Ilumatobacteraceae bacterium]
MCDQHLDAVGADYVLTELGGWSSTGHDGVRRVVVNTGEKGLAWRTLRVSGTPAHGSMPFGSDNAPSPPRRWCAGCTYRPQARIDDVWRQTVAAMPLSEEVRAGLVDPAQIWPTLQQRRRRWPSVATHTHTTFSPNVVHGGQKTNIIPDLVELEVDIRTVPGTTQDEVDAHLREALGDLAARVEIGPAAGQRRHRVTTGQRPVGRDLVGDAGRLPGCRVVARTDRRRYRTLGSSAIRAPSARHRTVLLDGGLRVVRFAFPRQRRTHRRRVARPRRRLLDPHRERICG